MIKRILLLLLLLSVSVNAQWPSYHFPTQNAMIRTSSLIPAENNGAMLFFKSLSKPSESSVSAFKYLKFDKYGDTLFQEKNLHYYANEERSRFDHGVLTDHDNGAFIVFTVEKTGNSKVIVQHTDKNGNLTWGLYGIELDFQSKNIQYLAASPDGQGGVLVLFAAWSGSSINDGYNVHMYQVNSDGSFGIVNQDMLYHDIRYNDVEIVSGSSGDYLVYTEKSDSPIKYKLNKIGMSGELLWANEILISPDSSVSVMDLAVDETGVLIASAQYVDDQQNISIQYIDADGNFKWKQDGIGGDGGYHLELESGWNGGTAVLLQKHVSDKSSVYVQKLDSQGNLVWDTLALICSDSLWDFRLAANNSTIISGGEENSKKLIVCMHKYGTVSGYDPNYITCAGVSSDGELEWITDVEGFFNLHHDLTIASQGDDGAIISASVDNLSEQVYITQISNQGIVNDVTVSVNDDRQVIPSGYQLHQSYPNPFNSSVSIRYSLTKSSAAKIIIYSVTGKEVTVLADGMHPPGEYRVHWNGKNSAGKAVASGMYIYRMVADQFMQSKKMIMIR